MSSVVYLLLVMSTYDGGMTSQLIPQANIQQCQVNQKNLDGKILSYGRYVQKTKATCIVGVK